MRTFALILTVCAVALVSNQARAEDGFGTYFANQGAGAATGFGDPSPAALAAALGQPSDDAAALVSAIEPAAGDEAEAPVSSIEPAAGDAVMDQEKIEEPVQNIEIKINNQKTHDAMKEIQKNVEEALKP